AAVTCEVVAGADVDVSCVRGDSPYLPFWRRVLGADRARGVLTPVGFAHSLMLRPGVSRAVSSADPTRKLIRALETRFPLQHRTSRSGERDAALDWILDGPPPRAAHGPRSLRRGVDPRYATYVRHLVAALPPDRTSVRALDVRGEPVAMLLGLEYRGT